MISAVGRRLRIPLGNAPADSPAEAAPPATPTVDFVAYGEDCLLSGHVQLDASRLTDLLNAHDEYELLDVKVHSLSGGEALTVQQVVVPRDELILVHASGPRGDRAVRIRTRQHPIALQGGPYHVRGYYHALPGADAIDSFRHRKPVVPVTDAWVEYQQAGRTQRRRVETVLVNRHQVDWVVEATDKQVESPDLPLTPVATPTRAKDGATLVYAPKS